MNDREFEKIRKIFEMKLKEEGYDPAEINGDNTEDFCKGLLKKLDRFYANL